MMKFLQQLCVGVLAMAFIGCEGEPDVREAESEPPSETSSPVRQSRSEPVGPEIPFAFQRTETEENAERPTLCLVFTEALDPETDYEPFVDIDRNVAIAANGQRLCVEGLAFGDEAKLTLREGLPSADGDELTSDESVSLTFADRPAVVRFSGNGVILPRRDAEGLAITTVNVPAVDVSVSRVTDRALVFKQITEGYAAGEGRYEYVPYDEQPGEVGAPVFEGTLETPGPVNAVVTTLLPLTEAVGRLEPGAYYVEIEDSRGAEQNRNAPARAGRWVIVTDLAMTAYRGSSGLDVTVRSIDNATPVSRATVRLIAQSNELLAELRTDRDGRVRIDPPLLAGTEGNRPKLITVEGRSRDFAVLDLDRAPLDLSSQPIGGRAPRDGYEGFLYTERGIYRPGETVHVSALLRDAEGYAADDEAGSLVLYRPNGLEQTRQRFADLEEAGSLVHAFDLPEAAMRGVWRVAMELDGPGTVGTETFSVEDFVPQRLELKLDADTETPMTAGQTRMIEARLRFLYGAPGAGLTVDGTARIETDPNPFPDLQGFRFGLHDQPYRQEIVNLPEVVTDGEGVASLPLSPGNEGADAAPPLRLRAVLRAEEPGGRAVQDDLRIPYRPRSLYLGVKPAFEGSAERDAPVRFDAVSVDRSGAPVETELAWRILRRDYDYDWYQDSSGRWQWRRSEEIVKVAEGVEQSGGAVSIEGPSLPWGNYSIVVAAGGEDLASQGFWVGYGGRSSEGTPAPDQVRVLGPEEPVRIGEETTIAIDAPYAGRAEVAIANAGVLALQHIEVPEGGTEITVPVTEEWGAGAYVLVSVYTGREPGLQPIPRRAVGAAYVPVDTGPRTFDVALSVPEVARPNEGVTVGLDLSGGPVDEQVFATLAAVDEGILLLTKYQTPDPATALFGKAQLGIEVYDDYGRILDPNTGQPGTLRSGGDAIGGAGLSVVPTKSVVLFRGPIDIGPDGSAEIDLDLPDFNGELRVMAVVWSESGVGSAGVPMTVRDEVPAELILPRFLAPGDEAQATLTLDNVEGPVGEYIPSVAVADGKLSVSSMPNAVSLDRGERADRLVRIAAEGTGTTGLTLAVDGPEGFTAQSIYPIEVRGAFLPETRVARLMLSPGESYTPGADVFAGFVSDSGTLTVTAAPSPIDIQALTQALAVYPYGCTEQLVSQGTPLLLKPDRDAGEENQLRRIVETILQRQSPDGAFGMWRVGDRDASPWLGAYAVDFIARAKEQGLPVPDDSMARAYQALQPVSQGELQRAYGYDRRVGRWSQPDTSERLEERSVAYALYVLARGGVADRSRLRYVHDAKLSDTESPLARAQIGAALASIGDRSRARSAFDAAVDVGGYVNSGDRYQSRVRDAAGVIALLAEAGYNERASAFFEDVDAAFPEPDRLNTQEKAFLVRAANALADGENDASLTYDGSRFESAILTEADDLTLPFTNNGDRPIFVTAIARGVPSSPPEAASEDLVIGKSLLTLTGEAVEPSAIGQGDRMIVLLNLTPLNERRAQHVVEDLLPAGFEIEAVLEPDDAAPNGAYRFLGTLSEADIAEARDDRFVASVIRRGTDTQRFAYVVRAVTPGSFAMPGAVAEDMYRMDVFARSPSDRVEIAP